MSASEAEDLGSTPNGGTRFLASRLDRDTYDDFYNLAAHKTDTISAVEPFPRSRFARLIPYSKQAGGDVLRDRAVIDERDDKGDFELKY